MLFAFFGFAFSLFSPLPFFEGNVAQGFSEHMSELTAAYQAYYESWPALISSFSLETLNDPCKEASRLSMYQLLTLPLYQPLILGNFLSGIKRDLNTEELNGPIDELTVLFGRCCLLDDPVMISEQKSKNVLHEALVCEKKSFFHGLLRKKDVPPSFEGEKHKFFGQVEVRIVSPLTPDNIRPARLVLFDQMLLFVAKGESNVLHQIPIDAVLVSDRREPLVVTVSEREGAFSLFWNRGKGRVEHIVVLCESMAVRENCMARISAAGIVRFNSAKTKLAYFLMRERKPFRTRSSEYGASYAFSIWGFGCGSIRRYDALDARNLIASYKSTELLAFRILPESELGSEASLRVTFTNNDTFDLSGVALSALVSLLTVIARHREETQIQMQSRYPQPMVPFATMSRKEEREYRGQMEEKIRVEQTQQLQSLLRMRLGEINTEYHDVSHSLYRREAEVRGLEAQVAAHVAPSLGELKKSMTPLDKRDYRQNANYDESSSVLSLSFTDED